MNCEDLSLLLDDRDIRRLTAGEREAVEAHLGCCADCAQAWRAHERLVATGVPEMSSALPLKVWQALRASAASSPSRRRFSWTGLFGFVLVGAAAAMSALQLRELVTEPAESWAPIVSDVGANGSAATTRPVALGTIRRVATGTDDASIAAIDPDDGARVGGSPRLRLVVLPTRHENPSPRAVAAVNATHDVIVRVLRSKPDLEIIELTERQEAAAEERPPTAAKEDAPAAAARPVTAARPSAPAAVHAPRVPPPAMNDRPYDGPWMLFSLGHRQDGENLAIARRFGTESVLRLTNEVPVGANSSEEAWSVRLQFEGPRGVGSAGALIEPSQQESTPESVGVALADKLYAYLFPASARAEYEFVAVDVGAGEAERVEALLALSLNSGFSDAVVAGAIELGRSAASAETRRAVWELLGRSGDPAAVQPLIDALLIDSEAEVRREAADALFRHLDDPIVRSVLESVAVNDPAPIVRLQAKWQYMTNAERRAHVAAALRDTTLTPEERLTPLRVARRAVLSFDMDLGLDDELRALIVEAAKESGDPADMKAAIAEVSGTVANDEAHGGVDPAYVDLVTPLDGQRAAHGPD